MWPAPRAPRIPSTPSPPTSTGSELDIVGNPAEGVTGTRVRYWADRQIFLKDARVRPRGLLARARQTSFLVPGLTIVIRDERGDEVHRGGLPSTTAASPSSASTSLPTRRHRRSGAFRAAAPSPRPCRCSTPRPHEPDRGRARVRRRHCAAVGDRLRHQGSSLRQHHRHAQGWHPRRRFRAGPAQGLPPPTGAQRPAAQGRHRQGREGRHPRRADRVVTVRLAEPQFEGQTKEVLGTSGRARHRRQGRRAGADRAAHLDQARREGSRRPCCSRRSPPR
jgi:DNA gyrase subunit B